MAASRPDNALGIEEKNFGPVSAGPLDEQASVDENVAANLGAYWFRPDRHVRGGMPRMIRWPRKKSDQKLSANQELALAA